MFVLKLTVSAKKALTKVSAFLLCLPSANDVGFAHDEATLMMCGFTAFGKYRSIASETSSIIMCSITSYC